MTRFFLLLFYLLLPANAYAGSQEASVIQVLSGDSFTIAGGDTVRLAGIEAPALAQAAAPGISARPGEPFAEASRHALSALLEGKKIRLDSLSMRDRYNRRIGQAYREDGTWLQGALLAQGLARVYLSGTDDSAVALALERQETPARSARRGIWADRYFRVISAEETNAYVSRYMLVEGRVVSAHLYHGNLYVNFSERWKGQFSLFIPRRALPAFSLPALLALPGKMLLARGWIDYRGAPTITVERPEQMELEASQP